jgi:UDP-N-acetylglucosamine diphosphorylase/glucosamine-1-phosphate N-acetyltransferase
MNVILFDDPVLRVSLLPFTYTRPLSKIRVGILTIDQKWQYHLGTPPSYQVPEYLQKKFPAKSTSQNLMINGAICPDQALVDTIKALPAGFFLVKGDLLIAANQPSGEMTEKNVVNYDKDFTVIDKKWKIFQENANQIRADLPLVTAGRKSQPITDPYTRVYKPEAIFIEEGVEIRDATLNAESGPIYLGKNSVVQEGAVIRGAFALCEGAQLNMGAKVRGDTTLGPYSKIGGEISNAVVFGYSNKSHDGFIGNSVLGEWCNLGADTNASNMKNNYDNVRIWNHRDNHFEQTDLQFCGLMMGDHCKSGINTMFNTATVADPFAVVFGGGYQKNYIPAFTWGGDGHHETFRLEKAYETASRVMQRRNVSLTEADREIMQHIFEITRPSRHWEKH